MPGQTHMQSGQPILLSHIFQAYIKAFERDLLRFQTVEKEALMALPLGAEAFAGTALKLDGKALAADLGFFSACQNSYDAVGDRDFMTSFLDAVATLIMHLGQQCQDIIYWSSTSVSLVKLPKEWSTGSSVMPNKRNPDVAELIRAKSAKAIGRSATAKNIIRALCTSYASDLHELKVECLAGAVECLSVLNIYSHFVKALEFESASAERMLSKGHILATEIAMTLCARNVPFREAYSLTAAIVAQAEELGVQIHEMQWSQIRTLHSVMSAEEWGAVSYLNSIKKRQAAGGTGESAFRPSQFENSISD